MSETETKAPKTFKELENEFNQLAHRCGVVKYEITQKEKELELYLNAMRDISVQAAPLRDQAEAPAAEAPKLQAVQS